MGVNMLPVRTEKLPGGCCGVCTSTGGQTLLALGMEQKGRVRPLTGKAGRQRVKRTMKKGGRGTD